MPPWVVFRSQKMPQMPEAQAGVRWSPCAAVTNTTTPLHHLPLLLERRNQSQFWEGNRSQKAWTPASPSPLWIARIGHAAPGAPGSSHLASTLLSQAKALLWAKTQAPGCPALGRVGGKCESWKSVSRSGERSLEDGEDRFPWAWACPPLGSGVDLPVLARFLLSPQPLPYTPSLGV